MSFWDGIKSAWKGVKNLFTGSTYDDTVKDDTDNTSGKETLNEQIANGDINKPVNVNNTTTNMTSGFDTLRENMNTPDATVSLENTLDNAPVATEDNEDDTFLSRLGNWFAGATGKVSSIADSVNGWINGIINSRKAKADYNDAEELYAIGYNPDNKNVYYLDLNESRGFFDWDFGTHEGVKDRFESLYSDFVTKANLPGATQEDINQAYTDFYNEAKRLFRIRADDYYTDGLFGETGIGRRKNMYTDEELDMLEKNDKANKGRYEPTPDEFADFLAMYLRNKETEQELGIEYSGKGDDGTETFSLSSDMQTEWMQKQRNIALNGIDSIFAGMKQINPNAADEAEMTYSSAILGDMFSRWYAHVAPIYRDEQEILSRDSSTWSWQDRYLLGQAEKARQMDRLIAENENELLRQVIKHGQDSRGNIVDTPDIFDNGESLNDILTRGLWEASELDKSWYSPHVSPIDIIERFANDAHYIYKQDKVTGLRKTWNDIEYFFKPVGTTLGEAGQALWAGGLEAIGVISMGTLYDGLTSSYMDQDSTAWRLLETDDSNVGRSIKKYYLDATEYTPEILGNLVPDIALYAATGPGALTTTARHIGDVSRVYKAAKAAKGVSLLNKLRAINLMGKGEKAAELLGMPRGAYSAIINGAKTAPKIKNYQTIKTAAELLDRGVTQVGLGQFMDGQRSAYDTEPYSEASFLMSVIGSVVFDAMPEVVRLATGRGWWKLATFRYGNNIWNLARYIDSSPEAAESVARALRKGTGEIGVDDLKTFIKDYSAIEEAAKTAYGRLTPEEQQAVGNMTKTLIHSYVTQAFGANSTIGKRVRQILANKNSNVADVIKYMGKIPGDVSVGPYVSTIRLKNGTRANIFATGEKGEYSPVLDSIFNGGFDSRIENGFSQADLNKLSKLDNYSDIEKNKSKWFYEITDNKGNTVYYLNEDGLKHFGLRPESMTLESLGITLKEAENTREALNKIKGVESVKLSPDTIDAIAETGAYDEITLKVKEVLGC